MIPPSPRCTLRVSIGLLTSGFTYDLIIVGGGIPGLALACGLRGSGLRVAVIEAQSEQVVDERPRAYASRPCLPEFSAP